MIWRCLIVGYFQYSQFTISDAFLDWTPVALPALKILEPRMRKGAVVIVGNIVDFVEGYADLLAHLKEPANGYTNLTINYCR